LQPFTEVESPVLRLMQPVAQATASMAMPVAPPPGAQAGAIPNTGSSGPYTEQAPPGLPQVNPECVFREEYDFFNDEDDGF
jgi:hypothetical protein